MSHGSTALGSDLTEEASYKPHSVLRVIRTPMCWLSLVARREALVARRRSLRERLGRRCGH